MPRWDSLPAELLFKSFQILKTEDNIKTDLKQCSLVCHNWKRASHIVLFSDLDADSDEKLEQLKKALDIYHGKSQPLRIISPGFFVKNLCGNLSERGLKHLGRYFPHLESIKPDHATDMCYMKFYRMMANDKFPYLKRIPEPSNYYQEILYSISALCLKDRLEEIELINDTEKGLHRSYESLHKHLATFPKLKNIRVTLNSTQGEKPSLVLINRLIPENNTGLKSLDLELFNTNPKSSSSIYSDVLNINSLIPQESVESLKIQSLDLFNGNNEDSYFYLQKKFPHLNTLYIYNYADVFKQNFMKAPSIHSTVSLLLYLHSIPQSFMGPIITDESTNEILSQFYTMHSKNLIKGVDHINEISIVCKRIVDDNDSEIPHERTTAMNISNTKTYSSNNSVVHITYRDNPDISSPYMILLCDIGQWIDRLILTDIPVNVETSLLEIVANYCINLNYLKLASVSSLFLNQEESTMALVKSNKHFRSLVFEHCIITKELFHFVAYRFPLLKNMTIRYCHAFTSFYDQNQDNDDEEEMHSIQLIMPTISFETISFDIDLGNSSFEDLYQRLFIKIETSSAAMLYASFILREDEQENLWHETDIKNANEEGYLVSCQDEACIAYYIYCHSVMAVVLSAEPNMHFLITP